MVNKIELATMIGNIVESTFKIGGKNGAKALRSGIESGLLDGCGEGVPELLAALTKRGIPSTNKQFAEIFGFTLSADANKVAHNAERTVKKVKKINVKNEAYHVDRPTLPTREEEKIAKIKELMQGEKEAYQARNMEFIKNQEKNIEKFQNYVDEYATKYSELVTKLDNAKTTEEIQSITKQLEKLEKQAEKTMNSRLEKIGTLSKEEIQTKVKEAKELARTRAQNATYTSATTTATRSQAQKLIDEVSTEFNFGTRNITPEQLKFLVKNRLRKVEELARKAELESKSTIKRTVNIGGMQVPVEIPVMGTNATEEIARISGGKTPQEALAYYRAMNTKLNKALNDLKASDAVNKKYVQLKEKSINIPIKQAEKSKKLQWFENQLKEKQAALEESNKTIAKTM